MYYERLFGYFLLFINISGFITVGVDKFKSQRRLWRIPERVLFWFAIVGGSIGVYIGLLLFRHKTRRWYFMLFIPLIIIIQLFIGYMFVYNNL